MHPAPAPLVLADAERVACVSAEIIANRLRARPRLRVLLPTGPVSRRVYAALRAHATRDELPSHAATALAMADGESLAHELRGMVIAGVHALGDAPPDLAVLELGGGEWARGNALLRARELVVMASGAEQAPAVRAMLADPASPRVPASLLRAHPRLSVVCDRAAAAEVPRHRGGHHVCVVLGHREPSVRPAHRISHESLGRVHRAEWVARRRPTLAAILTGYTSTDGLSEAEQMRAAWRVADVPPVLEVAGRNTAENATRSLPIVLAMGEVRHVTVVTSSWHMRARYHFLAWHEHGLAVRFSLDWRGDWGHMLAQELRGLPAARGERRRALAAMAPPRSPL